MIALCLLIKDEGEYLPEWLDWHFAAGVDHVYLYDNGSEVPVSDSIPAEYIDRCTVVDWAGPHINTQTDAYANCLGTCGPAWEWMGFIDTDEFIHIEDGRSIPAYLAALPAEADGVALKWVVYGAGGQYTKMPGKVRERFTVKAAYPSYLLQCKCIVRPGRIRAMAAHGPIQVDSHRPRLVNSRGQPIRGICDPAVTAEAAWVEHYFTRSLEEWNEKIARGSCDPMSHRAFDMFWEINPGMKEG
ncbi:glycosyltransferase family 2 protein [Pseudoflavonifractor phocaeensis]|uniref:glycosyltransferase family 2 protein n=1 Tax=Pseudoflavonifractor phocaeensis TaxID=1870988 RepID=UPI0019574753|nr:glycosyltransferase family 2 protein [Pseudoflavonifractor phocaeensis]MBM6938457.1 glycosyltransferase family 2 protein [Pseudoflavonifractor phocaeensis]